MKLLMMAFVLVLPLAAADAPDAHCPPKGICIDGATGNISGEIRYSRYDKVEIVVFNENPVHFGYRLSLGETVPGDSVITDFISQMGLNPVAAAKSEAASQAQTKVSASAAKPKIQVQALSAAPTEAQDRALKALVSTTTGYDQFDLALDWQDEFGRVMSEFAGIVESLQKANVGRSGIETAAKELHNLLDIGGTPDPCAQPSPRIRKACGTRDFETRIFDLKKNAAAGDVKDPDMDNVISGLNQTLSDYRKSLADMVKLDFQLQDLIARPEHSPFEQKGRISRDIMNGRKVDVKLERAEVDSSGKVGAYSAIAEETVSMGSQVFTMSGGMAVSPMRKTEYSAFTGSVLDATGKPVSPATTGTIVGVQSNSRRVQPMMLFNADLFDCLVKSKVPFSLNLSTGFTGKWDNQGTDVEMLFGPSIGFLDNRLFVTWGAYAGRQQALQNNLYLGAALPSTTIPVTKSYRWGQGLAISWKIK